MLGVTIGAARLAKKRHLAAAPDPRPRPS
jgi:hypothetical protein